MFVYAMRTSHLFALTQFSTGVEMQALGRGDDSVEHLPCKCKDFSADPENSRKGGGPGAHLSSWLSYGKKEGGDKRVPESWWACSPGMLKERQC